MRTRAERRHNDWAKAVRKRKKIRTYGFDWYDNLHEYSKNKIHCSCMMCRSKTRGLYTTGPKDNWPFRDLRQFDRMKQTLDDYESGGKDGEEV